MKFEHVKCAERNKGHEHDESSDDKRSL